MVTVQVVEVPLQVPPLQPVKLYPSSDVAVRVTWPASSNHELQVPLLQLIPAGLLATVPLPVTVTARVYWVTGCPCPPRTGQTGFIVVFDVLKLSPKSIDISHTVVGESFAVLDVQYTTVDDDDV
jgi:hypothetical protein